MEEGINHKQAHIHHNLASSVSRFMDCGNKQLCRLSSKLFIVKFPHVYLCALGSSHLLHVGGTLRFPMPPISFGILLSKFVICSLTELNLFHRLLRA